METENQRQIILVKNYLYKEWHKDKNYYICVIKLLRIVQDPLEKKKRLKFNFI